MVRDLRINANISTRVITDEAGDDIAMDDDAEDDDAADDDDAAPEEVGSPFSRFPFMHSSRF